MSVYVHSIQYVPRMHLLGEIMAADSQQDSRWKAVETKGAKRETMMRSCPTSGKSNLIRFVNSIERKEGEVKNKKSSIFFSLYLVNRKRIFAQFFLFFSFYKSTNFSIMYRGSWKTSTNVFFIIFFLIKLILLDLHIKLNDHDQTQLSGTRVVRRRSWISWQLTSVSDVSGSSSW